MYGANSPSSLRQYLSVAILIVLGIVLSVLAYDYVHKWERKRIGFEFEQRAVSHVVALEKGITSNIAVIRSIVALYGASLEVTRQEFRQFAQVLLEGHDEIQALDWIPRVKHSERAAYEEAAQREGFPHFQFTERRTQGQMVRASPRKEYFPVYYLEPSAGNETAFGFDLASDPTRLAALEKVRDRGDIVATARITLVQETARRFGFLILMPVYRNGAPRATVAERRRNLEGFALGVFRISDLVKKSLARLDIETMDIHVYDNTAGPDKRLLYTHLTDEREEDVGAGLHHRALIDVADRQWLLLFHPTPKFIAAQKSLLPLVVLASGMLFIALIAVHLISSIGNANKLQRQVMERKRAEEEVRRLSYHDRLTGLYNRAFFEEELKRLDTSRQLPLSLVLVDVNGLKLVNDGFGHKEGDKLLIRAAEALKSSCRKEDIIARWGGDEFAIMLPQTNQEAAAEVCNRITITCRQASQGPIPLSMALGAATKVSKDQYIHQLAKEAEDKLYRHKLLESKSARSTIFSSLQKTLGERSYETSDHSKRLREMALRVGQAVGLSESELDELALLAVLHDIGKLATPDEILTKPGKLSLEEWDTMQKHSEIGYRIALSIPELAPIADAILSHHERWDGTGYPHGLKREEIPVISRIIAIVDAYDVMIHATPYRKSRNKKEAIKELGRCAGTQFDPNLVEIFIADLAGSE